MKKLFSIMMCAMLVLGLPVMAIADTFNYTPINGPAAGADDGFEFEKDLVIPADAEVPEATFSYAVTPGAAVDAGTGTAKVLAGVGTPTIEDVEYAAGETASANMTLTTEGENKVATKKAQVDFSNCEFTEPGIYRYIVTESGDNQGITNDPILTRTLDVYVENDEGTDGTPAVLYTQEDVDAWEAENPESETPCPFAVGDVKEEATPAQRATLKVTGYVFYEGTKTDAPSTTAATATGKSEGYRNTYETANLEFGKEVKGNFGSLDQYFEFTVVLGNMPEGTVLNVDLTDADATPHASDANEVTTAANPTKLTVGTGGTITQKFYIHDGQYIVIKGLPVDATYAITENAHDYTSAEGIVAADNDEGVAHTDPVSGTIGSKAGSTTPEYWTYDGQEFETLEAANAAAVDAGEEMPAEGEMANGVEYHEAVITPAADQNVKTGYTNTKDVVTPTGIANALTTFGPAVLIALVAVAGIVVFSRKKRTNE